MALQQNMHAHRVDAFLLPTQDHFLSEYPPESAKRLQWISGFTGSAGAALILSRPLRDKSGILFTDGRYTLQASKQVDAEIFEVVNNADMSAPEWIKRHDPALVMGYDPWLHSIHEVRSWKNIKTVALKENPVDAIWKGRPSAPCEPIRHHTLEYSGEPSRTKREKISWQMNEMGVDGLFIGAPDNVNWLLNIRGADVPYNPIMLCYAILEKNGKLRLIEQERLLSMNELHDVELFNIREFMASSERLFQEYKTIQMDPQSCVQALLDAALKSGCNVVEAPDPTLLAKAVKNPIEVDGARTAHRHDGRAVTAFLRWLDEQESVTELEASEKISQFRAEYGGEFYMGPSFNTIAGAGPNGAIVHYAVTEKTNRALGDNELFLIDSGGQYLNGTTDITRTVIRGTPTTEMKERFTRVLKGHIALATAIFPKGTTGHQLDILARQFLWQAGLDYEHGTGHGVGSYLCVHEGPQRISKRGSDAVLKPGMILSNEPGYYKEGEYGIRIENLVLVVKADMPDAEGEFYTFETLTLAPIDMRLVDESMLTPQEKQWLDDYHRRVEENVNAV